MLHLSIKQSYLAMFYLLEMIYENTKNDCLGSLLGGFNPHLFRGSMSADSAAWEDWNNIVQKITNERLLTSGETLRVTKAFVKFHEDEFGFDLGWLTDELSNLSDEDEKWVKVVERSFE